MQNPITKHSYVRINGSFVHLLQYGPGESLIKSPSNLSTNTSASNSSNCYSLTNKTSSNSNSFNSYTTENNTILSARESHSQRLIIFIPGNPGVLGLYHDFLESLSRMLSSSSAIDGPNNQPTILAISHNNFDHPDHVDYKG